MIKVLAFGSFDPLHEGHKQFLQQAKALGDHLTVVVSHDTAITAQKGYTPLQSAQQRLQAIVELPDVDDAIIGHPAPHGYELLAELDFDILALGYDQQPSDEVVRQELGRHGKSMVEVVRLPPWQPEKYKSSYLRQQKPKT